MSRHLIGREADPAVLARYAEGCRKLFEGTPDHPGGAHLAFALRHPWSLPCLDAACGLLQPQGILRKKLFLMLAILETTPRHADLFLPQPRSRGWLAGRLVVWGVGGLAKTAMGLLLFPLAGRQR